ncbi:MAG: hypothetical protein V4640_08605 [Verrucomicrobiota bacterium]
MINAYELLSLPPALVLPEETLRDAWRVAGKITHPDAGGTEDGFAELRAAFALLSSPSKRLLHWLELRGTPGEVRGRVDADLMDLFSEIGAVSNRAEELIRKRDAAKSVLVRAMLEGETQLCREEVERAIAGVDVRMARETGVFPIYEAAAELEIEDASRTARNLAFLEKWRAGLRGIYARLV